MPYTSGEQAVLARLGTFYDGQAAYNPNTNPGGMRNGGHKVNFIPALRDLVAALQMIGSRADSTAALSDTANPLLQQAITKLTAALAAAQAAQDARDRAEAASGVVTGDLQAKFEGLLPGLPFEPPSVVGKMWVNAGSDGGSANLMITTTGVRSDAQPTPKPPIVHLVTSDELDAMTLLRSLIFG